MSTLPKGPIWHASHNVVLDEDVFALSLMGGEWPDGVPLERRTTLHVVDWLLMRFPSMLFVTKLDKDFHFQEESYLIREYHITFLNKKVTTSVSLEYFINNYTSSLTPSLGGSTHG